MSSEKSKINITPVNPAQLGPIFDSAYHRRAALFLWGPPGVGKSTVVKQWAKENKFNIIDIRLTTLEPSDLRGLPTLDKETQRTVWYLPEFIPNADDTTPTILLLDELPAADSRLQASSYELVLDRSLGGKPIPPNCWVVAAGNDITDGAISFGMGSALADRFQHVSVVAHPDAWIKWAQDNKVHPAVLAFIKVKGDFLECNQDFIEKNEMIVPTPRSWERVSDVLRYHDEASGKGTPTNQAALQTEVMGYIGQRVATEFFLTLKEIQNLPDIMVLLKAKGEKQLVMVPDSLTALYGLAYAVRPFINKLEDAQAVMDLFENIVTRPSKNPVNEVRVLAMEMLFERVQQLKLINALMSTPQYQKYHKIVKKVVNL